MEQEIKKLKEMLIQQSMKIDVIKNNYIKKDENIYKNIIYYIGFFLSIISFLFSFIKIYFTDLTDLKMRITKIETIIEMRENKK